MGIGSFVKDHWKDLLSGGATVYGAVKGQQASNKADALTQQQIQQAERQWADTEAFRNSGKAGLLARDAKYDMGLSSFDPQNPFSQARGLRPSNVMMTRPNGLSPEAPAGPAFDPYTGPPPNPGGPSWRGGAPNSPGGMLPPVSPSPVPIPTNLPPGGTPPNENQHYYRDPVTGQIVPKPGNR